MCKYRDKKCKRFKNMHSFYNTLIYFSNRNYKLALYLLQFLALTTNSAIKLVQSSKDSYKSHPSHASREIVRRTAMLTEELKQLTTDVMSQKCESQTIEVKAAQQGCPKRLFDSLSSFSNQDDGGIILFGIDEEKGFALVGVRDAQELQKHVTEQCEQMSPVVRPVFTAIQIDGATVVSAEIPACDIADRPCFYRGKGRLKGSYVRVGDADKPMTEYEVYSYEAYRKKYQDESRLVERATRETLDQGLVAQYLLRLKSNKPNLAQLDDETVMDLMGMTIDDAPTLACVMLFSIYPQAFFPQLSIVATVLPGDEPGDVSSSGERFIDNKRIEGTLCEQLDEALAFVRVNTRVSTRIDTRTGERTDIPDYPMEAVRELLLNALIHRDYSTHTQGMPIQLQIFPTRLVITNPGGVYGRLSVNDLGNTQPDTRNPCIATAMEVLGRTENRYSGIPTVRRLMREAGAPKPLFEDHRGEFRVTLFRRSEPGPIASAGAGQDVAENTPEQHIAAFCSVPRSRSEIADFLGVQSAYAARRYLTPMVEAGILRLTLPEKPSSSKQRFQATSS